MLVGDLHRRLDREHLARFERRARRADVVDLHSDGVPEAARGAVPVAFDERRRGGFDLRVGEGERRHRGVHLVDGPGDHVPRRDVHRD
jgi:hypothetical protein